MGGEKVKFKFVVAHSAEARPLIQYYALSKNRTYGAYNVFENNTHQLIVSGQGRVNAAAATAYLGALQRSRPAETVWVNLGVAGHADYEIGTLRQAHKVIDRPSSKTYYPHNIVKSTTAIKSCELVSLDQPTRTYPGKTMYDMEAGGFFQAAIKFTSLECIQCFKVVSDNRQHRLAGFDQKSIKALIEPHLDQVDAYLASMQKILIKNFNKSSQDIDINHIYLTHSQQLMVQELVDSLCVHNQDVNARIKDCSSAEELIDTLKAALKDIQLAV